MTDLRIEIQIKSVYGENKAYPFNREAHCIACIANTTTLTRRTLGQLLELGATIVEMDRHGRESRTYNGRDLTNLPVVA
jgi:hypothetical protein